MNKKHQSYKINLKLSSHGKKKIIAKLPTKNKINTFGSYQSQASFVASEHRLTLSCCRRMSIPSISPRRERVLSSSCNNIAKSSDAYNLLPSNGVFCLILCKSHLRRPWDARSWLHSGLYSTTFSRTPKLTCQSRLHL